MQSSRCPISILSAASARRGGAGRSRMENASRAIASCHVGDAKMKRKKEAKKISRTSRELRKQAERRAYVRPSTDTSPLARCRIDRED